MCYIFEKGDFLKTDRERNGDPGSVGSGQPVTSRMLHKEKHMQGSHRAQRRQRHGPHGVRCQVCLDPRGMAELKLKGRLINGLIACDKNFGPLGIGEELQASELIGDIRYEGCCFSNFRFHGEIWIIINT